MDVGSKFFFQSRNFKSYSKLASLCLSNVLVITEPRTQLPEVSVILMHLVDSMEKKYDHDMHVEVKLQQRLKDEVEPDDYDVGISIDSDVYEEGDTCIRSTCTSSACKSSLDKPVFQLRPMFCSTNIVL